MLLTALNNRVSVQRPTPLNGDIILFGARKLMVVGVRDLAGRGQVLAVDAREVS